MTKIEKEIKVLDIDVKEIQKKLLKLGARFKGEKSQKIYVYDLPTLHYRFLEIKELLNANNELLINTNIKKLDNLLFEFEELIEETKLNKLLEDMSIKNIRDITKLHLQQIRELIQNKKLNEYFQTININPNKWIRLRESTGIVELTTKHILTKSKEKIQQVIETEITVSSFDETNQILESIGLAKRGYREKTRFSYQYKNADIEIDFWPMLKPYLEIETEQEELMEEIISKLELNHHEIVSLNTEELYKRINIDVNQMGELRF